MFRRLVSLIAIITFIASFAPVEYAWALRPPNAPQAEGVAEAIGKALGSEAAANAEETEGQRRRRIQREQEEIRQLQKIAGILNFSDPPAVITSDDPAYIAQRGKERFTLHAVWLLTKTPHAAELREINDGRVLLVYRNEDRHTLLVFNNGTQRLFKKDLSHVVKHKPIDTDAEAIKVKDTFYDGLRPVSELRRMGLKLDLDVPETVRCSVTEGMLKESEVGDIYQLASYWDVPTIGTVVVYRPAAFSGRGYPVVIRDEQGNLTLLNEKDMLKEPYVSHRIIDRAFARAGGAQIAEELAKLHSDELLENLRFTTSGEVDVKSVPQVVRQFMAEKGFLTPDPKTLGIIKVGHTIATNARIIDRFNRFNTGFIATLGNCTIEPVKIGRMNKNYFLTDKAKNERYVVQKLSGFFDPEAIEYQLVSLELAQEAARKKGEFEHWTPVHYYDVDKEHQTEHQKQTNEAKHLYLPNSEVWRIMEYVKDAKFYEDSGKIAEEYGEEAVNEASGMVAQGIKLFGDLLTYVPENRFPGKEPLPFYHDTVAHVKEVRTLLAGGEADVLPSRKDKMRPARMIPDLLQDGLPSSAPYMPYRERTLRLIEIFNRLISAPNGEIGFLAQDYADREPQRPQDAVIQEILSRAINVLADNDTKFDNVGFTVGFIVNAHGEEPILRCVTCFVDLDTIQKAGMRFIDFADALQFPINPAGENPWEKKEPLPFSSVRVKKDSFENFIAKYLKSYDEAWASEGYDEVTRETMRRALRPHLIWATAKIACELATRFFKAYLSEYADTDDPAKKARNGVYFALPDDTPRDKNGVPLTNTDKNLRLAEVRYKVCLEILRIYADELHLDPQMREFLSNAGLSDPIGWGELAVAMAMDTVDRAAVAEAVRREAQKVLDTARRYLASDGSEEARKAFDLVVDQCEMNAHGYENQDTSQGRATFDAIDRKLFGPITWARDVVPVLTPEVSKEAVRALAVELKIIITKAEQDAAIAAKEAAAREAVKRAKATMALTAEMQKAVTEPEKARIERAVRTGTLKAALSMSKFAVAEDNDVAAVFNLTDLSDPDALALAILISQLPSEAERLPVELIVKDDEVMRRLLAAEIPRITENNITVSADYINEDRAVEAAVVSILGMNVGIKAVNYYSPTNSSVSLRSYNGVSINQLPMPTIVEMAQLEQLLNQMGVIVPGGITQREFDAYEAAKALATGV